MDINAAIREIKVEIFDWLSITWDITSLCSVSIDDAASSATCTVKPSVDT